MSSLNPSSEFQARAYECIDKLPQRGMLRDEHIKRTVKFVENNPAVMGQFNNPERYFGRLGTIGASELGAFVAHERGEVIDIGASAREIAMRKLMLIDPMLPTPKMKRGTQLEDPVIRPAFLEAFGAESLRDHPAVKTALMSKSREMPWLGANIDDLVSITNNGETMRFLPDYKCPDPKTIDNPVSLNYHVQLEMYLARLEEQRGILEASGLIRPDEPLVHGKLLVPFDLNEWIVKPKLIEIDLSLRDEAIRAGEKWAHQIFEMGMIPEPILRAELHLSEDVENEVVQSAKKYVYWRSQAAFAEDEQKAAANQINTLLSNNGGVGIVKQGGLNINARQSFDDVATLHLAEQMGVDLTAFEKVSKSFDADVLNKLVKDATENGAGINPDDVAAARKKTVDIAALAAHLESEFGLVPAGTLDIDIRVTANKTGPNAEVRKEIENEAAIVHNHNREHAQNMIYPAKPISEPQYTQEIIEKASANARDTAPAVKRETQASLDL